MLSVPSGLLGPGGAGRTVTGTIKLCFVKKKRPLPAVMKCFHFVHDFVFLLLPTLCLPRKSIGMEKFI